MKKRMLAMMLCLVLILGCTSMMAFAADTGSITVENQSGTNASVGGKTLNLFKIFNAKKSGENVSYQWIVEGGKNKYEDFFFGPTGVILDGGGNHVLSGTIHDVVNYIKGLETDSFAFSQMAAQLFVYIDDNDIAYTKTSGKIASTATSYTFDGLGLGYYLIYDETVFEAGTPAVRSAAMLSHSGENKVIQLKADRPHVEKTVDDSDTATPDWKLGTTASIGEVETFRIVTAIPNHDLYGDNYTFEIADKMDDTLQLLPESIKIVITKPATAE
ncbi:MAG: isopeptide-forming domain-containing fimbrial protein, partial [Tyzzerella sp.]|nr:isopeptide-forming domain-containing fimbrial protein [Tyzzerella sp.]